MLGTDCSHLMQVEFIFPNSTKISYFLKRKLAHRWHDIKEFNEILGIKKDIGGNIFVVMVGFKYNHWQQVEQLVRDCGFFCVWDWKSGHSEVNDCVAMHLIKLVDFGQWENNKMTSCLKHLPSIVALNKSVKGKNRFCTADGLYLIQLRCNRHYWKFWKVLPVVGVN